MRIAGIIHSMLLVQIVRVPEAGIDGFRQFEATVLPLLGDYDGALERRLRTLDGGTEIHIVSFPSPDALDAYRLDPRRRERIHLLQESQAASEVLEVIDVTEETAKAGPERER
jgi:hypothetical protein